MGLYEATRPLSNIEAAAVIDHLTTYELLLLEAVASNSGGVADSGWYIAADLLGDSVSYKVVFTSYHLPLTPFFESKAAAQAALLKYKDILHKYFMLYN
jgi:hypothetical protein